MSDLKVCICCEDAQAQRNDDLCNSCALYVYDEFQSEEHDFTWDSGAHDNE